MPITPSTCWCSGPPRSPGTACGAQALWRTISDVVVKDQAEVDWTWAWHNLQL